MTRARSLSLALLALGILAGCDRVTGVAIEIVAPGADPPPGLFTAWAPLAAVAAPASLWNDLDLPPDDVAVLGYDTSPARWRIPTAALRGEPLGRDRSPLGPAAKRRLTRFLGHAEIAPAVVALPPDARPPRLALHVTRALLTELVGKIKLPVVLARLAPADADDAAFAAAAVRDTVDLAGPRATVIVWWNDTAWATGPAARALAKNPGRAALAAALAGHTE